MNNRKLYILIGIMLLLISIMGRPKPQVVAPECFSKEDCREPVPIGYCEIDYDCIIGKCYVVPIRCPEICYGREDEDKDGLIDCKDPDCFNSASCPCENADFNACKARECYCASGIARWLVWEGGHGCSCI